MPLANINKNKKAHIPKEKGCRDDVCRVTTLLYHDLAVCDLIGSHATAPQDNGCHRCAYLTGRTRFNTKLTKGNSGTTHRRLSTNRRLSMRFRIPYCVLLKRLWNMKVSYHVLNGLSRGFEIFLL